MFIYSGDDRQHSYLVDAKPHDAWLWNPAVEAARKHYLGLYDADLIVNFMIVIEPGRVVVLHKNATMYNIDKLATQSLERHGLHLGWTEQLRGLGRDLHKAHVPLRLTYTELVEQHNMSDERASSLAAALVSQGLGLAFVRDAESESRWPWPKIDLMTQ